MEGEEEELEVVKELSSVVRPLWSNVIRFVISCLVGDCGEVIKTDGRSLLIQRGLGGSSIDRWWVSS